MASPTRTCAPLALAAAAGALAALLAAPSAHAQFSAHDRRNGLEAAFDVGYGALTNRGAFCRSDVSRCPSGPLGGSVGTQVHVGYQFVPFMSVGLHFKYNAFTSDQADTNVAAGGSDLTFGAYVRVHLLTLAEAGARSTISDMDLYVGVGFDFVAEVSEWANVRVGGSWVNNQANVWGYEIPFTVGFDYAVHPNVSIGAMGQFAPFLYNHVHSDTALGSYDDNAARNGDVYWFLGVGAKLHFNLL